MIQFNLLPDVKLEYIKAQRTKHMVMLISFVITGVSIGLLVLLFVGVNVLQRGHLDRLNKDIQAKTQELQSQQDINKILTVQNQLNSLDGLHDSKPATERLGGYLAQVTPNDVSITTLTVDFSVKTMTFEGNAGSIKSVNEFIDTLKFTRHEVAEQSSPSFSNVVLASFSREDGQTSEAGGTSYQITLAYDAAIFDTTKEVKLVVPDQVTTRSLTERPTPLFQTNTEGGQ